MVYVIVNIITFIILLLFLKKLQTKRVSFGNRVLIALVLGIVFGYILNILFGNSSDIVKISTDWFSIVGKGYVALLKMLVIPLIFISILSAIVKLKDTTEATKSGSIIISNLLITAAIASVIGILAAIIFHLDASKILPDAATIAQGEKIVNLSSSIQQTFPQKMIDFIPQNPIADLANLRRNSPIATVIFSGFIGISILGIKTKKPKSAEMAIDLISSGHDIVMRMVTLVLRLTPYGILGLMTNVLATTDYKQIYNLITFVIASYVALFVMFGIHLIIVALFGINPLYYLKSVSSTLIFAFTSRTSMGTIPLTVNTQKEYFNVTDGVANMAATFGASIGQNGCAAIYPSMLAIMIAPTVGQSLTIEFLIKLVIIVVISSLGVAGVGGGATFASIIVLSSIGFPIELAGLLISVEPLIDMGRTALNVNDSILAGVVSQKILNFKDKIK